MINKPPPQQQEYPFEGQKTVNEKWMIYNLAYNLSV